MTRIFLSFIFLMATTFAKASDLTEALPLTNKIIMLHFDDGHIVKHKAFEPRHNEYGVVDTLDVNRAMQPATYQIESSNDINYSQGKSPIDVGRKSKGTDFGWVCENYKEPTGCINTTIADNAQEHWVYLYLEEPMVNEKTYTIKLGGLAKNLNEVSLSYNDAKIRSEAVHVNIVGHSTAAPKKYAYVYHWMGDKGHLQLQSFEGNKFWVVDQRNGEKVFTGKLSFRKPLDNVETTKTQQAKPYGNWLNAEVYECDFSNFNNPGQYTIAVENIGCSFPFELSDDGYREAFKVTCRGLYHNRSGIELKPEFTDHPRPAPANPLITPGFKDKMQYANVRYCDLENYNVSKNDIEKIKNNLMGPINTWGWYQDAGDWDGYFTHLKIPAMLMFTYLIKANNFNDGELNLPESGNGIPDILDEARWLIRYFTAHGTKPSMQAMQQAGFLAPGQPATILARM
ncbi:MAG: hypothetical protein HC896_04070 [Bacteroidales bacterium]|nr:hypothetical protein [Bacteroidales bacterium]